MKFCGALSMRKSNEHRMCGWTGSGAATTLQFGARPSMDDKSDWGGDTHAFASSVEGGHDTGSDHHAASVGLSKLSQSVWTAAAQGSVPTVPRASGAGASDHASCDAGPWMGASEASSMFVDCPALGLESPSEAVFPAASCPAF
jgi:hypothetical protein